MWPLKLGMRRFSAFFSGKRTHALDTLMISNSPSQPSKLRWNTLGKKSVSNPCMNHLVRCPLCTKTVWSYCMAQHYVDVHDTTQHPDLMHIAEAEQEAVLNWVPHKAKKKNKAMHQHRLMTPSVMQRPHVHLAMLLHRRQACLPCLCPRASCPHVPK